MTDIEPGTKVQLKDGGEAWVFPSREGDSLGVVFYATEVGMFTYDLDGKPADSRLDSDELWEIDW